MWPYHLVTPVIHKVYCFYSLPTMLFSAPDYRLLICPALINRQHSRPSGSQQGFFYGRKKCQSQAGIFIFRVDMMPVLPVTVNIKHIIITSVAKEVMFSVALVGLAVCLSVCLPVCPSECMSSCLAVCRPVCLSVCLSVMKILWRVRGGKRNKWLNFGGKLDLLGWVSEHKKQFTLSNSCNMSWTMCK